jgi:type IV secretory pathway TraG/TraD family ATPase VirD4
MRQFVRNAFRWRLKSVQQFCREIDAEYHIPRPATAQHLPAFQAATHLFGVCGEAVFLLGCGILSAVLFVNAAHWLGISIWVEIIAHGLGLFSILIGLLESTQLWLPFYHYNQRVTHGSARWADSQLLMDMQLLQRKEEPLPPFTLRLGGLGRKYDLVLGPEHSTCHLAMFGPPRSGKSSTFFITWQQAWAGAGSAIVLDPKGELYDQTAHLYQNVYRVDLQNPERTDRWNFLPECKGNAEYAHKVASIILDSEQARRSTADPFWKEAEKAALTAILLELPHLHERPAPPMIQELISTVSLPALNDLMMKSPDPKAPLYWGMFSKVEPKLQAGVLIGLGVACADFATPNMTAISSPITTVMAARGVRFVNFNDLRTPGTAIFMIVPEGDAERYKRILSTFFGLANDCLRNGVLTEASAPILFNLDEIGNIYVPDLPAALGVGRGRKMTYALGYQNIAQLYHQYGTDGGDAVLGSVGAMIFLPGVDQRTAEYASKRLGPTTVFQSTSVDVQKGSQYDSERSSEVGRPLMDASEIRQMVKYKQAIAIISNAPPIRLTFPRYARRTNPPLSLRELEFQTGFGGATQEPNGDLSVRSQAEEIEASRLIPTPTPSEGSQWAQVSAALNQGRMLAQQGNQWSGGDSLEPEYDLSMIDENLSPIFDDGLQEMRERGI